MELATRNAQRSTLNLQLSIPNELTPGAGSPTVFAWENGLVRRAYRLPFKCELENRVTWQAGAPALQFKSKTARALPPGHELVGLIAN